MNLIFWGNPIFEGCVPTDESYWVAKIFSESPQINSMKSRKKPEARFFAVFRLFTKKPLGGGQLCPPPSPPGGGIRG